MRRRDSQVIFGKSFDSFLSIVTKNGLGMLILIAMASTFTNEQLLPRFKPKSEPAVIVVAPEKPKPAVKQPRPKYFLGTPLLKPALGSPNPVMFECRDGRAFPFDLKGVLLARQVFFAEADKGADVAALAKDYNAQNMQNEWYTFEFKARCGEPNVAAEPAIYCVPKSRSQGEDFAALQKPDSMLRQKLSDGDKGSIVVILRVWPDSFAFFRELRQWLQTEGYAIRWEPADRPFYLLNPKRFGGGQLEIDS